MTGDRSPERCSYETPLADETVCSLPGTGEPTATAGRVSDPGAGEGLGVGTARHPQPQDRAAPPGYPALAMAASACCLMLVSVSSSSVSPIRKRSVSACQIWAIWEIPLVSVSVG